MTINIIYYDWRYYVALFAALVHDVESVVRNFEDARLRMWDGILTGAINSGAKYLLAFVCRRLDRPEEI